MSILIKIRANAEKLNFIRKPIITSGDQNVVRCKFCFSDEWDGYTKTATFTRNNEVPVTVPIIDDECIIPYTVLSCKCKLYIGVIGEKDGKRITSHLLAYDILKGAGTDVNQPTSQEVLEAAIKSYCDKQNYATQQYVDEHQCSGDPDAVQQVVEDYIINKDLADKAYVDSKQFEPNEEQVKQYVQEYCESEGVATMDYVDSSIANIECKCDPEKIQDAVDNCIASKDLADKLYVKDTVNSAIVEMNNPDTPVTVILNGGDADPETDWDDEDVVNYIFNGGKTTGF